MGVVEAAQDNPQTGNQPRIALSSNDAPMGQTCDKFENSQMHSGTYVPT